VATLNDSTQFSTELLQRKWLAGGVLEIKLHRPAALNFVPGQFMRFHHSEIQREYSLISAPDAETIDFCITIVKKGLFSTRLERARKGDIFQLSGPHGKFVFRRSDRPAVFVATGTGVAPFIAFCRSETVKTAILLHGVGSMENLFFEKMLQKCVDRYIPCIRRKGEKDEAVRGVYSGRVTDYLQQSLAKGTYDFYLCGRGSMIQNAVKIIDAKFEDSRVYIESYD
jgi:benzoate/toluate 1,2-dioxygenase reductase subunit